MSLLIVTLTGQLFWTTDPAFRLVVQLLNTRYGVNKNIKYKYAKFILFFLSKVNICINLVETSDGRT